MHSATSFLNALLAALLLAVCANATAQSRLVEQSFEVAPAWIVLPGSPGSSMALRKCRDCALSNVATNAATLYQVGRESVSLSEFAALLRQNPDAQVTVMTSMRGDLITRVRVASAPPTSAPTR